MVRGTEIVATFAKDQILVTDVIVAGGTIGVSPANFCIPSVMFVARLATFLVVVSLSHKGEGNSDDVGSSIPDRCTNERRSLEK